MIFMSRQIKHHLLRVLSLNECHRNHRTSADGTTAFGMLSVEAVAIKFYNHHFMVASSLCAVVILSPFRINSNLKVHFYSIFIAFFLHNDF